MSEHSHHPNYTKIYLTLLVLLVISVAGPFIGIVWVTLITAFGIAVVKATLVVQNFMHLKWERAVMKWMLATTLVLMALLFFGVSPDVMKHTGRRWVNNSALAAVERGIASADHGEEADHAATDEDPPEEEPAAAPAAAPAAQEFNAQQAYATVCATCHGPAGAGDGPGGAALEPKPASFADPAFWAAVDDAEVVKAIREGGAAVGKSMLMPAWGALYNEQQAQALVEYLKTLSN